MFREIFQNNKKKNLSEMLRGQRKREINHSPYVLNLHEKRPASTLNLIFYGYFFPLPTLFFYEMIYETRFLVIKQEILERRQGCGEKKFFKVSIEKAVFDNKREKKKRKKK